MRGPARLPGVGRSEGKFNEQHFSDFSESHLSLPHHKQTTAGEAGVGKVTEHREAGVVPVPPCVVVLVIAAAPVVVVSAVSVSPAALALCPPPPSSSLPCSPSCYLAMETKL